MREGQTTIIVPIGGDRAERPAHDPRQAQPPRRAPGREDRVVAGQRAGGAGHRLRPGRRHRPAHCAHAVSPARSPFRRRRSCSVLESAARSFRRHGFRDIVFLGDHGGYQQDLRRAADRLNRAWARTPVRAHAIPEYYDVVATATPKLLRKRGFADAEIGSHAGLADTSLMLALDPGMVRSDRLGSAPPPAARRRRLRRSSPGERRSGAARRRRHRRANGQRHSPGRRPAAERSAAPSVIRHSTHSLQERT